MNDERQGRPKHADTFHADAKPEAKPRVSRSGLKDNRESQEAASAAEQRQGALPCWPFPVGSQNDTDKAVKLKPYVPPKRRTLNQY